MHIPSPSVVGWVISRYLSRSKGEVAQLFNLQSLRIGADGGADVAAAAGGGAEAEDHVVGVVEHQGEAVGGGPGELGEADQGGGEVLGSHRWFQSIVNPSSKSSGRLGPRLGPRAFEAGRASTKPDPAGMAPTRHMRVSETELAKVHPYHLVVHFRIHLVYASFVASIPKVPLSPPPSANS
jgi:hypothetical protein